MNLDHNDQISPSPIFFSKIKINQEKLKAGISNGYMFLHSVFPLHKLFANSLAGDHHSYS